jgi:hypothetical protein
MKTVPPLLRVVLACFAVPSAVSAQALVDLGTAAGFGVLAGSSVTSTGTTSVQGHLGVSPAASVSGFAGIAPGGAGTVSGTIHAGNAAAAQAQTDLAAAYTAVAGRTATVSGVTAFADTVLPAGVYRASAALGLSGTITLDANHAAGALFVFQAGSTLTTAADTRITLLNGARAENVFWQVGSSATLGASTVFVGSVLAFTSITANAGAEIDGRLLAQGGAVSLIGNTVSLPATAIPEPATTALAFGIAGLGALLLRRARRGPPPAAAVR